MRLQSGRHLGGSVAASLSLLAMLALPLNASAETWWRASNRHFDLFTTGSVAESKQALAALEAAQSYFSQSGELPFSDEKVLKVVAFHSTEEYASFRLHKAAFGHYLKGAKQDFVVLSDIHPEHRDALIHEYTHSVVRQAGYNLPLWLNEGIADLYSSLAFSRRPGKSRIAASDTASHNRARRLDTAVAPLCCHARIFPFRREPHAIGFLRRELGFNAHAQVRSRLLSRFYSFSSLLQRRVWMERRL